MYGRERKEGGKEGGRKGGRGKEAERERERKEWKCLTPVCCRLSGGERREGFKERKESGKKEGCGG